jgi:hypothetical protein
MKPKRLSELLGTLATPEFQDWWEEFRKARLEAQSAQERYQRLLSEASSMEFKAEVAQKNAIDTLYRAGECEDTAASKLFEATELENQSYRAVSDFEEQRYRVSELWYRLGGEEKSLDEKRESHQSGPSKKSEAELRVAERDHQAAHQAYETEGDRRNRLWDEVERIWNQSAEVSLMVAELRARGRKIRKEAETLFALAEDRKGKSSELRAEAEIASAASEAAQARLKTMLDRTREQFGCAPGIEFLYFRVTDSQKRAFCVPLIEDSDHYNVELKSLSVHLVDLQRGVAYLEPAAAPSLSSQEGDRRFEDYLLRGRKKSEGAVPAIRVKN